MLNRDEFQVTKRLFQELHDLPQCERATRLAEVVTEPAVRSEVERLLRCAEDSQFLRSPFEHNATNDFGWCATAIQGFELIKPIGSGSFGVVFEGRQQQPDRRVAIKILNPSQAVSEKGRRRFERESEILAQLSHPDIAQIYAAGSIKLNHGEQPWIAMEFVDGETLNKSEVVGRMSVNDRVRLLLRICEAIHYAHSSGIIHRDLKPSNIMLLAPTTPGESSVSPKILDFGMARTVERSMAEPSLSASTDLVGTINYMCPEAVTSSTGSGDHRCDVFSLGVIGFELLTGQLPFDRQAASLAESLSRIRDIEASRLSQVDKRFRGDLDAIFAKCLSNDANKRYATVFDLCEDLRRYLLHQPVTARTPGLLYRGRRWVRRHAVLVASTGCVLFASLCATLISFREMKRAYSAEQASAYEAQKATAINSFLTNDLFLNVLSVAESNSIDTQRPPTGSQMSKLVREAASHVQQMYVGQPKLEAAIRNELGTLYYNIGDFHAAESEYRTAQRLWTEAWGGHHLDTLKTTNNLSQTLLCLRQFEEAEELCRQALSGRIAILGKENPMTLASMNNLAELLRQQNKLAESQQLFQQALALEESSLGPEDKATLTTKANLGAVLVAQGKTSEAKRLHLEVFETSRKVFGDTHTLTMQAEERFAQTLLRCGEPEAALEHSLLVAQHHSQIFGEAHGGTVTSRRLLARIYTQLGRPADALNELETARTALIASPKPLAVLDKVEKEISKLKQSAARINIETDLVKKNDAVSN